MVLPTLPEHWTRNLLSSHLLLRVRHQRRVKEQQQQQRTKIKISFFENFRFFFPNGPEIFPCWRYDLRVESVAKRFLSYPQKKNTFAPRATYRDIHPSGTNSVIKFTSVDAYCVRLSWILIRYHLQECKGIILQQPNFSFAFGFVVWPYLSLALNTSDLYVVWFFKKKITIIIKNLNINFQMKHLKTTVSEIAVNPKAK